MDAQIPGLVAKGLPTNITNSFKDGGAAASVLIVGTIVDAGQKAAVKMAFADSLRNLWIFYSCAAGCTFVCSWFVGRRVLSSVHVETVTGLKKRGSTA